MKIMTASKEGTRIEQTDSDFFTLTEDHSQMLFDQVNNLRQESCFSASEQKDEELRVKVDVTVAPMKLGVVEITPA